MQRTGFAEAEEGAVGFQQAGAQDAEARGVGTSGQLAELGILPLDVLLPHFRAGLGVHADEARLGLRLAVNRIEMTVVMHRVHPVHAELLRLPDFLGLKLRVILDHHTAERAALRISRGDESAIFARNDNGGSSDGLDVVFAAPGKLGMQFAAHRINAHEAARGGIALAAGIDEHLRLPMQLGGNG